MICHQCNQDSIKIYNKSEGDSPVYIKCEICGLHIQCGKDIELLCNLFIYNENLASSEKLGLEAYSENKTIEDNPYSISSDQIMLNKRWELGYNREKESYENSALSLSAEKIENELKTKIAELEQEKDQRDMKINTFISVNYTNINNFCDKLLNIKILGKFLKKRIASFRSEYNQFYKDSWNSWDNWE